jgi:REP element-mobilizing transposase RayT
VEQAALVEHTNRCGTPTMGSIDSNHKPNHNSYALHYHIVFVTHKREPHITAHTAAFLDDFFRAKCSELGVSLLAVGILCDHVHLLVSLRPSHYIPEVINSLKGTASHEANHHQSLGRLLYWMRGYHINTVSHASLDRAVGYVRSQRQHHPDKVPAHDGQPPP